MPNIEKLKKNGQTIYPLTTPQAVVDEYNRNWEDLINLKSNVFVQDTEPTGANEGDVWINPDESEVISEFDDEVTPTSDNAVKSSGIYEFVNPTPLSSMPAGGFKDGKIYNLGTVSSISFLLADGLINKKYKWTFDTGSDTSNIIWPSGIVWSENPSTGEEMPPVLTANKHYEINIEGGYAFWAQFPIISE